jgi:hypothetical protein
MNLMNPKFANSSEEKKLRWQPMENPSDVYLRVEERREYFHLTPFLPAFP